MKDKCMCTIKTHVALLFAGASLAMAGDAFGQVKGGARPEGAMTISGLNNAALRKANRVQPNIKAQQGGIAGANPACPNPTHGCCTVGTVGCADEACCNTVCDIDPFCCTTAWDINCVGPNFYVPGGSALEACPPEACPPPAPCDPPNANEECETATDLGLLPVGGSVSTSGTALCAVPDCAAFTYGQGNLWLRFETTEFRQIKLSYCGSVNTNGVAWGNVWLNQGIGCPCSGFTSAGTFGQTCPDGNFEITWNNLAPGVYFYPILIDPANGAIGDYVITITSAAGVNPCEAATHECCVQGPPGCTDQACCELVCSLDAFCCDVFWDALCVDGAEANCGCVPPPVCPNPKHDCFTTGGPGCSDEECCNIVCALDPFCCDVAWDGLCVGGAAANCFVKPPVNDNCADRLAISEVCLLEFTTLGATTDGPSHAACIDIAGNGAVNQDIWYNYTASCTGNATISLCGSGYDTKLAVYSGSNCGDLTDATLLACNDDACGLQSEVTIPVTAGSVYKIRIGGFDTAIGNGVLTINNDGTPCSTPSSCDGDIAGGPGNGPDGTVDVDDLLKVINNWGPCDP